MTEPGTTISTPLGCDCGLTSIVQVPAPSPASDDARAAATSTTAPRLTFRSRVRERDRVGEELRVVRGRQVDLAGARREHRRLDRARGVGPGGRRRRDERRLDLVRRPVRVALEQQRGGAGDVRRGHARPVEDGERAAGDRQRRGEDLAAGRADVRLEQVAEGGQAAGGEARDDAAPAGGELARVAADPDRRAAAAAREVRRAAAAPSRSAIMPPRDGELRPGSRFASPARLSTTTMPIAPAAFTRAAFERERAGAARDERDRAVQRAGRERRRRRRRGCRAGRRGRAATGAPLRADDRADVDELLVAPSPSAAGVAAPAVRDERDPRQRRRRARRGDAERRREDVRVRERRDRDRVGRGARRAGRAEPVVVAVVAGRDHRDDAGRGDVPDRLDERVARRVGLRAAAREVDHVHAVADGRLEGGDDLGRVADVADRSRDVEDPVVADLRARRDAREAGRLGMVGAGAAPSCRRCRPRSRRRACRGTRPAGRRARRLRSSAPAPTNDARDDHLRRRPLRAALREAGRIAEALRVEERVRRVDAVVDDGDLDPLAASRRLPRRARPRRSGRGCG